MGNLLPIQASYKGKTPRCHSQLTFPPGWHITHSPRHWSMEQKIVKYVEHIIVPYIDKVQEPFRDEVPASIGGNEQFGHGGIPGPPPDQQYPRVLAAPKHNRSSPTKGYISVKKIS